MTVAVLGTGQMGAALSRRLAQGGVPDPAKVQSLIDSFARVL